MSTSTSLQVVLARAADAHESIDRHACARQGVCRRGFAAYSGRHGLRCTVASDAHLRRGGDAQGPSLRGPDTGVRELFAQGCVVPPRHVHEIAAATGGAGVTSLVMPAWIPGRYSASRSSTSRPATPPAVCPRCTPATCCTTRRTGAPLALIDGDQITARRTAAASALAASFLARADARHLLVVGAGQVARLLPAAYRVVRPIEQVTVWARRLPRGRGTGACAERRRRRRDREPRPRARFGEGRRSQRRDARHRAVDRGPLAAPGLPSRPDRQLHAGDARSRRRMLRRRRPVGRYRGGAEEERRSARPDGPRHVRRRRFAQHPRRARPRRGARPARRRSARTVFSRWAPRSRTSPRQSSCHERG